MQFKGKLMNQNWENGEKPTLGSDFGPFDTSLPPPPSILLWVLPLIDDRRKLSSYSISRKTYHPNSRK